MKSQQTWRARELLLLTVAIVFVLVLHANIPFISIASLGQAVWSMGFSQSIANGPWYSVHAVDIGIPHVAAISFGLSGVWPASLLIRLGLHPADAYASIAALWVLIAFFSAMNLSRALGDGVTRPLAILGATAWITMPMIWAHSGYSMLSFGMALLPFYYSAPIKLFWGESKFQENYKQILFNYVFKALIAVFMDGYTFMMFAVGASLLLVYALISRQSGRRFLLVTALPVHIFSFALAYLLYCTYIGEFYSSHNPIDLFRGWGVDLSFLIIPSRGVLWLPDMLGLSLSRSEAIYFGDASVWMTTFALPVLIFGMVG